MYLSMWATCPSRLYRLSCLIVEHLEQDELEQDTLPTPIFPNFLSLLSMVWSLLQLGSQCEFGQFSNESYLDFKCLARMYRLGRRSLVFLPPCGLEEAVEKYRIL